MFKNLLDVCNCVVGKDATKSKLRVGVDFKDLHKQVKNPLQLIIPLQKSLTVSYPADGKTHKDHKLAPNITVSNF